jgi:nitrite reductase (NADH) large subunit
MLKVLGYDMFSIGQVHPEDASHEIIEGELHGRYFYFVFRDSHVVSSILLGDTSLAAATKEIVEKQIDCSKVLQHMSDVRVVLDFVAEHH